MNITNEQAEYLLQLPKKIVRDNELLSQITINQTFPCNERFDLLSESDDDFSFLWEITQSQKNTLRISLHFMENDSKTGLLRIDYNGGHANPQTVNDFVPEKFHPYAGVQLTQSHIHYYVQGYQTLAWAIPLTDDDFAIKSIDNHRFNEVFADIIKQFANKIHLETIININTLLI